MLHYNTNSIRQPLVLGQGDIGAHEACPAAISLDGRLGLIAYFFIQI
jgi:hypothetical protein